MKATIQEYKKYFLIWIVVGFLGFFGLKYYGMDLVNALTSVTIKESGSSTPVHVTNDVTTFLFVRPPGNLGKY